MRYICLGIEKYQLVQLNDYFYKIFKNILWGQIMGE